MPEGPSPTDGPTGTGWRPAGAPADPSPPAAPDPTPPPRPSPPPQPVEPMRGSGKATLVGEARSLQQRTESMGQDASRSVWAFRLERYDSSGNRLRPVQVEMRGLKFEGSLTDGDQVRVSGRWRGGLVRAESLENLTTGALVRAKSYKGAMIVALVVFLIIAGLLAWFAINAQNNFNKTSQQFEQQQQQFEQDSDQARQDALREFCANAASIGATPPECSG